MLNSNITASFQGIDENGKPVWRIYKNRKAVKESEISKEESALLFNAAIEFTKELKG